VPRSNVSWTSWLQLFRRREELFDLDLAESLSPTLLAQWGSEFLSEFHPDVHALTSGGRQLGTVGAAPWIGLVGNNSAGPATVAFASTAAWFWVKLEAVEGVVALALLHMFGRQVVSPPSGVQIFSANAHSERSLQEFSRLRVVGWQMPGVGGSGFCLVPGIYVGPLFKPQNVFPMIEGVQIDLTAANGGTNGITVSVQWIEIPRAGTTAT